MALSHIQINWSRSSKMANNFSNLWSADFEDLARDLIGRDLNMRFEAFSVGPDGGVDGRHSVARGQVILQAKHYAGSSFSALKSAMKRERLSIDRLNPVRYLLATSRSLTRDNEAVLAKIIGPSLLDEADIFSAEDLEGLLRKYPDIEKSHIKLWLSSTAVLERVLRAASHQLNEITLQEIEEKLRIYAPNASFDSARDKLEENQVLIISGPPGVGKTTLAEMLVYAYLGEGWDLNTIRSLEEGFASLSIDDSKSQVFYFDDFLGKVALDKRSLAHRDSDFSRFVNRVKNSRNARFVLTTRAYIFEEARLISEHLADNRLDINKFVLNVSVYTRRIKARILYNHLLAAGTSQEHINALVAGRHLAAIVDHKNYSPRIIEWMTDKHTVGKVPAEKYPETFIATLNNPSGLWDVAFRTHISVSCQHLLQTLFFESQYGVQIDDLKVSYESLHSLLCNKYGTPFSPKDFEETLKILEGGFIRISDGNVSFVNPSMRDYLYGYLNDFGMLKDAALSARRAGWAQAVWEHGQKLNLSSEIVSEFATCFLPVSHLFPSLKVWKLARGELGWESDEVDLNYTDRIELLISWWQASGDEQFIDIAISVARNAVGELSFWQGGREALDLVGDLRSGYRYGNLPKADVLASSLENAVVVMIQRGMSSEELETIVKMLELWDEYLDDQINEVLTCAIDDEIINAEKIVADIDSESTLLDHIGSLKILAPKSSLPKEVVERAIDYAHDRMAELEETTVKRVVSPARVQPIDNDSFDDVALRNLFAPLIRNSSSSTR